MKATTDSIAQTKDALWYPCTYSTRIFACEQNVGLKYLKIIASSPGHSQILSRSCGEKSGEGLGSKLRHNRKW